MILSTVVESVIQMRIRVKTYENLSTPEAIYLTILPCHIPLRTHLPQVSYCQCWWLGRRVEAEDDYR